MSPKNSRTLRPFTIALIVLVVVLSLILCAALLFLFTLTNQETLLLTAEAGSPLPAASEFFSGNKQDALYTGGADAVSMDKPGDYPLTISRGFFSYDAVCRCVIPSPPLPLSPMPLS